MSTRSRRSFLKHVATGAALGCCCSVGNRATLLADEPGANARTEASETIIMHDKGPFDFGVMQGQNITPKTLVNRDRDQPTCFFAEDGKRMRWALQHMSVLQRTQPIPRGKSLLRFEYQPLDMTPIKVPGADGSEIGFDDWLKLTETDGFIAVYLTDKGVPVVATEQYFNGFKPASRHHLWSMSKSMAVGVLALALEETELGREHKIEDAIPALAESGLAQATVNDVMNMASGLKCFNGDKWDFDALVAFGLDYLCSVGFLDSPDNRIPETGWLAFLKTVKQESGRCHGEAFDYKDADSRSAILAAELAYGRPFHELFAERIWSKIGAEHDAHICCDQFGSSSTPLGFSATLRDCARWGLIHMPNSKRKILPLSFLNGLVESHSGYQSKLARKLSDHPAGYRDQYWVYPSGEKGGFFAGGWMGQRIHMFPSLNVVVVQLATLWPDNYSDLINDGEAMHRVARYVAQRY